MVRILVAKPDREVKEAAKQIDSFLDSNGLNTKLTIYLDYTLKDCGHYYYYESPGEKKVNPPKIYVNPVLCENRLRSKKMGPTAFGYLNDHSVHGVIIHEFCHYVDRKLKLESKFESDLVINKNCEDKVEQLAELFRLYLTNPYLLYLVSEKDFNWFKENVVGVTPASKEKFLAIYATWSQRVKLDCKKKWGIYLHKGDVVVAE